MAYLSPKNAVGVKFEKEQRLQWQASRDEHRKQFHPYLTFWLKQDAGSSQVNWGKEVNMFKAAANLPIKPVDQYSAEELRLLNNAEVSYNALRKVGFEHQKAVSSLR